MNKTTTTTETRVASHTPGPWRVAPDDVTIHCGDENDPEIVAAVDVADPMAVPVSMQEANARLIAAAPELLVELDDVETFLTVVIQHGEKDSPGTVQPYILADARRFRTKARAAIAKAKGQP